MLEELSELKCKTVRLVDCLVPFVPGSLAVSPVGSAYVLGEGNDADYVALVTYLDRTVEYLVARGWILGSSDTYPTDTFKSLRCGDYNVMVTADLATYEGYVLASEVCKVLQLKEKSDRIRVHRVIMDGENAEQVWAIWGKPE